MSQKNLTALSLVCSLKPSPAPSSSQLIAEHLLQELQKYDVTGEIVRCVDHDIRPGVENDMGDGDQWPAIRDKVLAADILIFA
ncbi:MAG: NAD(P)H-dependent oxidoreductase, partial [Mycobacterium sp.]